MLTLADNLKERVSVYKGMLMALAEEARITQNYDRMIKHLRLAVAAGLIIHEHELAFSPYAEISKDPRFIDIRKESERTREARLHSAETPRQFDRLLGSKTALGETRQLVVVVNEERRDVRASLHAFEKIDNRWIPVFFDLDASIGRNGFSEPYRKMEGDGMAPAGIYDLGMADGAFGYDSIDKVQTRLRYRQVTDQDFWIDDSTSPDYNRWVTLKVGATPKHRDEKEKRWVDSSHERLRRDDHLYKYGIVVDYNVDAKKSYPPDLAKVGGKPKGSAIFLHWERAPGAPTAGCIATSSENMLDLFKWLDPDKHPKIALGTREDFSAMSLVQQEPALD
jgi:L,D-peptidoglycan transpeptidase YkuD (ErfK/YbiS/YcfS/YnhG family)